MEENTFENVVCEMLLTSSRPQCVKNYARGSRFVVFVMVSYQTNLPIFVRITSFD